MALVTSNIGTQIVKEALNADNNAVWQLCNNANINKCSKYKPAVGNWPIVDGSYGLTRSDWSYAVRTPAKLNHFAGYEHDNSLAFPPILSIVKNDPVLEWGETTTISRIAVSGDEFTVLLGNAV